MTNQLLYDQPKKMSQLELEFAWLGSIYTAPERCRKHGLLGLDQSMFKNQLYFDLGLAMIRDESFKGLDSMSDDSPWLEILFREGLVSKLNAAQDAMMFLPAFYKTYSQEIEKRNEERVATKLNEFED